ncbi:MAG: hypothetical protein VKI42_06355 [Synechococcaceae cyanobacterium]|nr:hypothetical protein [Synechococcaceae cyanobacterium]
MTSVVSRWAATPPAISGTFSPGEWSNAGVMPMPGGFILVQNDNNFLYLAIDLTSDTGNSPGVGDYFWLSFDVNKNATITPNVDVNYGVYPSLPFKMGRSFYLGPGTWTGLLGTPSLSFGQQGFAASSKSATPHRIWEMRIALAEIGIPALGSATLPFLRFGLRVASSSPAFVTDFPNSFYTNFSNLHEIYLATAPDAIYPPGTAGAVIGGVGLIPASVITSGRATTTAPYVPTVTNAAFGGVLNLIYNRATIASLWGAGARRYRVLHRIGSSGAFAPLRRTWVNYRKSGSTDVLDTFAPDASDAYELKSPTVDYSTKDLLFQLDSNGSLGFPALTTGIHEFQVVFLNSAGAVVASPAQTLSLYIDNALPELNLYEISYKGTVVAPCSVIEITETGDPVKVRFRAFDAEGDLLGFSLMAYYGGPATPALNLLPAGMGTYPGGSWQGIADQWVNCPTPAFPPTSCAYQFRLSASARVTNGYGYIGTTEVTSHVTFRRPGVAPFGTPKPLVMAYGFQAGPDNLYAVGAPVPRS